jgi:hypothetical protein
VLQVERSACGAWAVMWKAADGDAVMRSSSADRCVMGSAVMSEASAVEPRAG